MEKMRQMQTKGNCGARRPQRRNFRNLLDGGPKEGSAAGNHNRDFQKLKMRPQNHPMERLQAKAENVFYKVGQSVGRENRREREEKWGQFRKAPGA